MKTYSLHTHTHTHTHIKPTASEGIEGQRANREISALTGKVSLLEVHVTCSNAI